LRVISVNVGLPRPVRWRGKTVSTGIWKAPVEGRVRVGTLNLEGDGQADLSAHGGAQKAVYAYPAEHYDFWRGELPGMALPWGIFGENLTIEGLLDPEVQIGDRFRVGSAILVVTQPRIPCFRLGIRFGRPALVKRFLHSGRSGFYLAVEAEGEVGAGDAFEVESREVHGVTVPDIVRLYAARRPDQALLRRAVEVAALPEDWREYFRDRLEAPEA
jgi:MOSC domain-containing protein YiiM